MYSFASRYYLCEDNRSWSLTSSVIFDSVYDVCIPEKIALKTDANELRFRELLLDDSREIVGVVFV